MSESIKCMDCDNKIKITKKGLEFLPQLKKEEKTAELNSLIENNQYQKIHSCICIDCLHDYIHLMKQKTEEAKSNHKNCMISLKDLLLDLSNQDDVDDILHSSLNDDEVKNLYGYYSNLRKKRIELEEKINKDKNEIIKLKKSEEDICIQLNKNKKEDEEKQQIMKKLNLKLSNLKKQYSELIDSDKE